MHESAIAQSILDTITEQTLKLQAKPLRAVISCGQFNAINDEVMSLAFEVAAEGTVCEGLRLEIRHIPLRAKCEGCGCVFEFDIYSPACTECKSEQFHFEPDAPLLLEEIEFEDPKEKGKV